MVNSYHPGKANVVADALSRKERVKPKRVRAINMTLQTSIKDKILMAQKEASDEPAGLQRGLDEMIKLMSDGALYYLDRIWVLLKGDVGTLIMDEAHKSKCLTCLKVKAKHQRLSGLLQQPEIPKWKWERIAMDFVTKLPRTNSGHDTVWIIVDQLTKYGYFLPMRDYKMDRLARLYLNEIVARHSVSVSIISDVGRQNQPHGFPICLGVDLEPDEWIKDSGCSKHMTGNQKLFSTYKAYNGGNVIFGSNLRGNIIGKGTISNDSLKIDNVEHVDNLGFNLLSIEQICDNKCKVTFSEHDSEITKNGKVIGRGIKKKGLYVMKLGSKPKDQICLATIDENSTLWHRRLGHANMRLIQSLASKELVRNLPKLKFDQHFCDAYKMGKQAHASHKAKNVVSTTRCLELLHMDLFGPSGVWSYGGNRYTLVIVGKTPYELLRGRKPTLDYFRVFGSKCFILNTKDYLTKFDPKSYEGVFLGYSQNSKAYIILNKHTRKVEESLNVTFDETPPPSKTSSLVDDDLDEEETIKVTEKKNLENDIVDETLEVDEIINIKESRNHPLENVIGNLNQRTLMSQAQNQSNFFCFISTIEPKNVNEVLGDES
ncbi:retrovirus-related pol polyprotein from transposon TNT 1-94 [Tanacetum coccineum]